MALDVKITFSWTDYCRLCLLDNGIMLPIFEEEGLNRQLGHKIEECLQIVTYDGDPLPRRICHKCLFKLNQYHEFQTMALESLDRLKIHLLPLQHVPSVQEYLKRSKFVEKLDATSEISANDQRESKVPLLQNKPPKLSVATESGPTLRVRKDQELKAPKLSPSLFLSHSPPDSTSVVSNVKNTENQTSVLRSRLGRFSRKVKTHANMLLGNQESIASNTETRASPDSPVPPNLNHLHGSEQPEANLNMVAPAQKRKRLVSSSIDDMGSSKPGPFFTKLKHKKKPVGPSTIRSVSHSTQWKCVFCNCHFLNKTGLTLHMDICLSCSTCSKEFSSTAEKAQHEADAHICVFLDAEKKHMRKRCSYCPARFVSNVMLSTHVKYDHQLAGNLLGRSGKQNTPHNPNVVCKPELDSHSNRLHNTSNNGSGFGSVDDCGTSNKDFDSRFSNILKGKATVRGEGPTCPKCNRKFKNNKSLTFHLKNHNNMSHACHICGGLYLNEGALRQHMKYHHGKRTISGYKCKVCGESFETKKVLYLHKKCHVKTVSSSQGPNVLAIKTEPEDVNVLTCDKCHEQFVDDNALMWHLYQHANDLLPSKERTVEDVEGKESEESNPKLSVSSTCDSLKSYSENLSWKCVHCSLVCHSEEFYKIHLTKHTNRTKSLFPCSGCDQVFRNIEALTRHTCIGKEPKSGYACCLDCGQALIEGEEHECDNRCPQCKKVFRSARGQRLHSFYKHGKGTALDWEGVYEEQDHPLNSSVKTNESNSDTCEGSSVNDDCENDSTPSNPFNKDNTGCFEELEIGSHSPIPAPLAYSASSENIDNHVKEGAGLIPFTNSESVTPENTVNHVKEGSQTSPILEAQLRGSPCKNSSVKLEVPCSQSIVPDNDFSLSVSSAVNMKRLWHSPSPSEDRDRRHADFNNSTSLPPESLC